MHFPQTCPTCQKNKVVLTTINYDTCVSYDGVSHDLNIPDLQVPKCSSCNEMVYVEGVNLQIEKALHKQLRQKVPWDDYFMAIASVVSIRSPDPCTKLGAVIVDNHNRILGMGYNGFPRNAKNDNLYPINRPDKYAYMVHSERNAINNCIGNADSGTIYVTGHPCAGCMCDIIQKRISKVVYGKISWNMSDEDKKAIQLILGNHDIEMIEYSTSPIDVLKDTIKYLERKHWKNDPTETNNSDR